jgi:hypothetical protein
MKEDFDGLLQSKLARVRTRARRNLTVDTDEEDSNCQLESRLAPELPPFLVLFDRAPRKHSRLVRLA